jgi:penicillin-binding protein 1A
VPPRTILEVKGPDGELLYRAPAKPERKRVLTTKQADIVNFVLRQVVEHGTGTGASFSKIGSLVGKTGTTDELGDAWFVGSTTKLSAAVWMGYPEGATHHMDNVHGLKVNGGTFPATVFKRFMSSATRDMTLGSFPDVRDFPGEVLKGERIPYSSSSTTIVSASTTRTTSTPTSTPSPTEPPTWETIPPRPPRTIPDDRTSTTRRRKRN